VLDRLERKSLVRRERSAEDKRRLVLTLTEAGREALSHAPSLLHLDFVTAFQQLDDWEQTLILSCLQRVAGMMDVSRTEIRTAPDADGMTQVLRLLAEDTEEAGG
jgi:DNA-binding MarR family transcriptional regulator